MELGEVIVKTLNPIAVEKFKNIPSLGRFVLMQDSEICAVGIIV